MSENSPVEAAGQPVLKPGQVAISLHGPGATIDDAVKAGEALKDLLRCVGEEMGIPEGALKWQIGSVQFQCDECGVRRPDRPGPDEGWTHHAGDDLCPDCTARAALDTSGSAAAEKEPS